MPSDKLVSANFNFEFENATYRVVVVRHNVTVYCHQFKDLWRIQAIRIAVLTFLGQKFPDAREFAAKNFEIKFRLNNFFLDFIAELLTFG